MWIFHLLIYAPHFVVIYSIFFRLTFELCLIWWKFHFYYWSWLIHPCSGKRLWPRTRSWKISWSTTSKITPNSSHLLTWEAARKFQTHNDFIRLVRVDKSSTDTGLYGNCSLSRWPTSCLRFFYLLLVLIIDISESRNFIKTAWNGA